MDVYDEQACLKKDSWGDWCYYVDEKRIPQRQVLFLTRISAGGM